jgi:hypothetical protein
MKNTNDANATATATETTESAASHLDDVVFDHVPVKAQEAKPKTKEQLLREIEVMEMPRKKAKELLGVEFDILGAVATKINDDDSVIFTIKEKQTGEIYAVTKAATIYTQKYLDYFAVASEPMESRTFVELIGKEKAGNAPITLRKFGE